MKIIVDIPDSYIPIPLMDSMLENTLTKEDELRMLQILLRIASEEISFAKITADQFRLVMK